MAISLSSLNLTDAIRAKLNNPADGFSAPRGAEYLPRTAAGLKEAFGLTANESTNVLEELARLGLYRPQGENGGS